MKKPLNYRLQMYRALDETMCTYCWFWCIFWGFGLFFAHFRSFYAETSYLCHRILVNNRYELQFVERKKRHYFRCSE